MIAGLSLTTAMIVLIKASVWLCGMYKYTERPVRMEAVSLINPVGVLPPCHTKRLCMRLVARPNVSSNLAKMPFPLIF